ncbi:hypothetical protein [Actinomadura opuntiae]|uniref:hypothetical protein n=1 Tax=Actinomadura sp. OS1-43 TaxID=604315 RepID=UPI00255B0AC5|nr:hypothetical protein [Actinomadura sp. OS1-43]MDL4816892.1 hypothetical protein [Actinomadura sp. OS1-43]
MTGRGAAGRPAGLPQPGWEPPQRVFADGDECRVRFFPERGGATCDFDFAVLPVSRALRVAMARAFDAHVGPSGTVGSGHSAGNVFRVLRGFAEVVAACDPVPLTPVDLQPVLLDRYVLKRKTKTALPFEVGLLKAVLRRVEGLDPRLVNALAAPTTLPRRLGCQRGSYPEEEERRIVQAARAVLRGAAERIGGNRELLERWRNGDTSVVADECQEEYCRVLDLVDRTGELPRRSRSSSYLAPWVGRHGNREDLMHALHPRGFELAAGALLLVRMTGHNGSSICQAPAAHRRPDGFAGGVATAVVELVKARRGTRRFMTVALSDLPAWALAPSRQVVLSGRDQLHTPFGVYMLLLELTAAARRITGADRLMVSWSVTGRPGQGFRVGLRTSIFDDGQWATAAGLVDRSAAGEPQPLEVTFARMRKTHLQREQRPVAHTDATLADQYLARDSTAFGDYQRVVADVLAEQTRKARAVAALTSLSEQDIARALRDPRGEARRHGVSAAVLQRLISGEADTVLAGCTDPASSPFDAAGASCTASFLKCLGCPCARALPRHLPVQAAALDALEQRRAQMAPLGWARRFGRPHAQLSDLLSQAPAAAVQQARSAVTDHERRLVERLLTGELDHV